MKATIDVESRSEGERLRQGLEDPSVRAFVQIIGVLKPMSERARARVMQYVVDKLDEDKELEAERRAAAANGGAAS